MKLRIAVVGSGISGLTSAWLMKNIHDVTVFEKADRVGGHTATIDVEHKGRNYALDTGFIVYNDWTYPNFIKLLDKLKVETQATNMSFSVSCKKSGLEYGGSKSLGSLFAQPKNAFNPAFLKMLYDIVAFNKDVTRDLIEDQLDESLTLGDFLQQKSYGKLLASHYLIPMCSAIWSSTLEEMLELPLVFFARFFYNHGLLNIRNRPQWRVIKGGSKQYLQPLLEQLGGSVRCGVSISSVRREAGKIVIVLEDGSESIFDHVVFACHSDQALQLLEKPTEDEKRILGAIPYRNNNVILHTDESLLPKSRKAWSAWNYRLNYGEGDTQKTFSRPATLSYNMNMLQDIKADDTFVVTLNDKGHIAPEKILGEFNYAHPVFTKEGISAQLEWNKISGPNNTWYCGAYWRNGFHEDGCVSGIRVAQHLGAHW